MGIIQLPLWRDKVCPKCGETKTTLDFNRDKGRADGLSFHCRACSRQIAREWCAQNAERHRATSRAWYQANYVHHPKIPKERPPKAPRREKPPEEPRESGPNKKKTPKKPWRGEIVRVVAWQPKKSKQQLPVYRWVSVGPRPNERPSIARRFINPKTRILHRVAAHDRRVQNPGAGSFTPEEWESLCARYDHRCLRCGEQKPLTIDHIVPVTRGGSNHISNLQPLCRECNSAKGVKTIDYRPH